MQRRTFLGSAAAAAVLASTSLAPVSPLVAQTAKSSRTILGSAMAFVDEGSGRPVVFLHGNPTSSFLWRNIIPHVTGTRRAIAPDMIGMGDSAKPDIAYTYADHAAHLHGLLDDLDLSDAVLVVHDWGSALGFHYARTRPQRISGLVFMESMVPPSFPIPSYEALGPFGELLRNIRTDGVGEQMILEQNIFIDQVLGVRGTNAPLSAEIMAEYNRPYPTPASRLPTLQWPRELPVAGVPANVRDVIVANNQWLLSNELPKLLFHVTPGAIIPPPAAEFLKANVNNLETVLLGPGRHFLQEDYPDEIGTGIADWLERI